MIIDFNKIKSKYDIVIIGAGLAGLSTAIALNESKQTVLIVESGSQKYNLKINKKSDAESTNLGNWPVKNYASKVSRTRMFGGNAVVWGGWCMELDEYDYSDKTWQKIKPELLKSYKNAYKFLNINPIKKLPEIETFDYFEPYPINISRGNTINESREILKISKNIDLVDQTDLVNIDFQNNEIRTIDLKHKNEVKELNVKRLVLSTGGIENAKLLKQFIPKELISDNVGLNFMEHPQIQIGRVLIRDSSVNKFIKMHSPPTAAHLFDDKLNIKTQKYFSGFRYKGSEARNYFVLRNSNVYQSKTLYRLRHIILTRNLFSTGPISLLDIFNLSKDIIESIFLKLINLFTSYKSYSVVLHLEQEPSENNKINLIGQNSTVLEWNFNENDLHNFNKSVGEIKSGFKKLGLIFNPKKYLSFSEDELSNYLVKNVFGIGHHMGTTKMGTSDSESVCDTDMKVHNIQNLYLNGSSVFPTGGIANPTLTIVALAWRLGEHLINE